MANTPKTNLRVVIFAGGIGTRMWPLSRKATPKQFEKIIDNKSTLQLAVERVMPEVSPENIFISSGEQYRTIIGEQLPQIPKENIIGEPEMRDVAPAVGYLASILAKRDPWGPVAILWSDHLLKQVDQFKNALITGAEYINTHKNQIVFLGQKPRFANQNLGWIEYGDEVTTMNGVSVRKFISWHYRPSQELAKEYFAGGKHAWNPGYFIVAPQFIVDLYKIHAPGMYEGLMKLQSSFEAPSHQDDLQTIYHTFEKISFDDAILAKIAPEQAVVLSVDLGWSDVGTWEALKEALQSKPMENLVKGNSVSLDTSDSVIYNFTDQLVAGIDLKGMIVVVTPDVIFVAPQESIPKVKTLLKSFEGTEKEKFT